MARKEPRSHLTSSAVKRGLLAGVLAWLFPGAGHWYVGARGRAAAFCGLVLLSLLIGVVCAGNLPVVDGRAPIVSRLQILATLALGPVEPVLRWSFYGQAVYRGDDGGLLIDATTQDALRRRRERAFRTWNAYGSTFLMAAGLMNLLLLFDAWDLGIGRKE